MQIGVVEGIIRLRDEFTSQLNASASALEKHGKRMKKVGEEMSEVGGKLTTSLTLPILALGGLATKAATDFESSFAGIRKTVSASEEEFAALAAGMRGMAKEIPVGVDQLNAIGEAAGQLGIKTPAIMGFTRVVADLGATTNLSTDAAATALARLANITGLPQEQFDRLGSTIVALGNTFATTEAEVVEFGLRMAGAGTIAGLTEAEILGIGAAMSSVGVEAEAGGTAVQKVLLGMTQAVAQGNADLAVFAATAGMSAQQFSAAWKDDAGAAFTAFVEGLGTQGGAAFQTLEKLDLQDQRLIRSFLSLAGAGDLLERTMATGNDAFEANTALATEAEQRYKTFASQATVLLNELRDVAITLGTALLPVFRDMLTAAQPLVAMMAAMAEQFAAMPGPARAVVVVLAGIAAAFGPVLFVTGQLIAAWGTLVATAPRVAAAVRMVTASFAAQAALLGGVVLLALSAIISKWGEASEAAVRYTVAQNSANELLAKMNRTIADSRAAGVSPVLDAATYDAAGKKLDELRDKLVALQKERDELGGWDWMSERDADEIESEIQNVTSNIGALRQALGSVQRGAKEASEGLGKVPPSETAPAVAALTDEVLAQIEALREHRKELADEVGQLSVYVDLLREAQAVVESRPLDLTIPAPPPLETGGDWFDEMVLGELERLDAEWQAAWKEKWASAQAIADQAWRNVQDIAADAIGNIIRNQEVDWKSLADSILDIFANMLAKLLIQWAANAAKRIAMEQAVAAAGGASSSGGSVGSISGMVGGGGGGGGGGWVQSAGGWGSIAAVGAVVAIVGAVGLAMGWWGHTGPTRGQASFGGEGDLSITGATGRNAGVITKHIREAFDILEDFLTDVDLEIARFNEVIVRKIDDLYIIEGLPWGQLRGATAQEIDEAIAVMSIRTAEFGKSVSEFLAAVIHGSEAITMEQLNAEIELARMVENFGKLDTEIDLQSMTREMDRIFAGIADLLEDNLSQLGVGLTNVVNEELGRWQAMFNELTGKELSPAERLEMMKAQAAIFNAEKALRIADLQGRLANLRAEQSLVNARLKLGFDELHGKGRLLNVELGLQGAYMNASKEILDAGMTALGLQIEAIQALIDGLNALPSIDLDKIRLPKTGGGVGQAAQDMERLADLLEQSARLELSEYEQAVAAINDRWDDAIPLAHDNAEALADIASARERELAALREQALLEFSDDVWDFFGSGGSGSPFVDQVNALAAQFADLAKRLGEVGEELGLTAFEMLHFFTLLEAGRKKLEEQLATEGFLGLARGLADLTQDEELRHRLLTQVAEIEFTLRMAQFEMEFEMLKHLGYLTAEQIALIDATLADVARNRAAIIAGMVPPVGGTGGGGGPDPADELARALARLRDIQARSLDPFSQAIRSVVDEFAELRRVLGWTSEVQAVYAAEIQRVLTEQLEPIRRLQDELAFRSDSPMRSLDQFRLAQRQVNEAQAALRAGDLSQLELIPDLVNRVIDLNPSSQASEASRFLFEWARRALDEAAAAAESAVSGIVPGTATDPWTWLRDTPSAGDELIAQTIRDLGRDLGSGLDDIETSIHVGTGGIEDKLPFDWSLVGVNAGPADNPTPPPDDGPRRIAAESREIEALQRLREIAARTASMDDTIRSGSLGVRASVG